ncbi:hypothetical protein VTN00DRAFT_243 [Thermoascus crustaceus]|uniref:uncharacterized protein n=1 Tax=Thermoascus crustaceus TaxID=5088 RepID=UPI0037424D67
MSSAAAQSDSSPGSPEPGVHPLIRNALRISLSAKEYKLLHEYIVKRSPSAVPDCLPTPSRFDAIVYSRDRYNEAAIRASLRVFLVTGAGLKLADLIIERIRGDTSRVKPHVPLLRSPKFRLPLALSLVLLLHRFLHRFLVRLRASLRTEDARPFRERNPRISKALMSRYAPAVGASIAGFALGVYPESELRITLAIYFATKSLDFLYNVLDEKGWFDKRSWWFGSWLLMPVSCAQLFHAFVFDRETTPKWLGSAIFKLSPSYMQSRPAGFPDELHWPDNYEIVDSLGTIADLKWPPFVSPILHPTNPNTLPRAVKSISPITSPAHPSITPLSCALLHPSTPSCSTAFLHHILLSVPPLARLLTSMTLVFSLLKYKSLLAHPISSTNALSKRIITMTAVLSTAVGSTWGSICLFNTLLPRRVLPTKRFFLSGAIGGIPFAFLGNNRGNFLYFFRMAVYSAWKVGVKRGLWRGWKGGELWLFVLSWAVIGSILEGKPNAVQGRGMRKCLAWMRGDGLVDLVEVAAKRKAKKSAGQNTRNERNS